MNVNTFNLYWLLDLRISIYNGYITDDSNSASARVSGEFYYRNASPTFGDKDYGDMNGIMRYE